MIIGRLDRPITIESAVSTQDASGQDLQTWSTFHTCYAQIAYLGGRERWQSGAKHSETISTFTIRYKEGILPTMRVRFENRLFRIIGLKEIDRRRGIEITAEEFK